ncbi:hypothetical protein C4559_01600 [Candidatus Microgenomates bacterium]|nr:MAG: hypothetical protein C4559_01600 [Candidatus Microgenomates bacterium]
MRSIEISRPGFSERLDTISRRELLFMATLIALASPNMLKIIEVKSEEVENLQKERDKLREGNGLNVAPATSETAEVENMLKEEEISLFKEKYAFLAVLSLGISFGIGYYRRVAKAIKS